MRTHHRDYPANPCTGTKPNSKKRVMFELSHLQKAKESSANTNRFKYHPPVTRHNNARNATTVNNKTETKTHEASHEQCKHKASDLENQIQNKKPTLPASSVSKTKPITTTATKMMSIEPNPNQGDMHEPRQTNRTREDPPKRAPPLQISIEVMRRATATHRTTTSDSYMAKKKEVWMLRVTALGFEGLEERGQSKI
ncbi:hypothetical protein A2U01_0009354 [Trifolium medium]|uniref:Uncharacterized protein n=1 Tax=Trifolium medium TaxID=97028 RepID=A0A392MMY8_9FABA|nr:hypothetical protein [Trifolium medium]